MKKAISRAKKTVLKNSRKNLFFAEALAGVTLLATLAGYSIYLVRRGKVDVKKIKMTLLKETGKASKQAMKTTADMKALSQKLLAKARNLGK